MPTGMVALVLVACAGPPPTMPTPAAATAATTPSPGVVGVPELIILGANILTMDDAVPRAEALAVRGGVVLAVGTNSEVEALGGPGTAVMRLDGLTVTPGFIDAHQHRIGDGPARLGRSHAALIDQAIAQGLTTINELYVDEHRLRELRELDEQGVLRLHVNAYLPVNENSSSGARFDDYYAAYAPGQRLSPRVRVAGLKVFTDFDNAQILLWRQPDLTDFVLERHREGWPLAFKTVSTRSLAMIVEALSAAAAVEPSVVRGRARLEHMLFATPDQVGAIDRLGLVPAVNLNLPGSVLGMPDIEELLAREPPGSYLPWRSLFETGVPAAGISGFPSLYVEVPAGAAFGSPLMLVYQAVTRAGELGAAPPSSMLDQAITAEQALRALTVNAAFAAFEEDVKGRLAPGMAADLVVLSADPLAVPADAIRGIEVLLTMIGGRIEHCGRDVLCPGSARPEPRVLTLEGTVPAGATSAVAGIRVNVEDAVPGPSEVVLHEVAYSEDRHPGNPVADVTTWGVDGSGTALVEPHDGGGLVLRLAASPSEDLAGNSNAFAVTPGIGYRLSITITVADRSRASGYVAVIFLSPAGEVERHVIALGGE